jgi:hypothetical protein
VPRGNSLTFPLYICRVKVFNIICILGILFFLTSFILGILYESTEALRFYLHSRLEFDNLTVQFTLKYANYILHEEIPVTVPSIT